jgi:tRNA dimethylallyltransferase
VTMLPRPILYDRINRRVDAMVDSGLFEEFKSLRKRGYDETSPGMQCLGYKELFAVEKGLMPYKSAIEIIKLNTRHYAKRQVTWFRHQTKVNAFVTGKESIDTVKKMLVDFLRQ